jgi:hypothetical protein
MVKLIIDLIPMKHNMLKDLYQSKKIVAGLSMECEKIDVCEKSCMLFWKEHRDATECLHCGRSDTWGTSYRWWILATTASTLDSTLAVRSGTMDAAAALGTSSRRHVDAAGNVANVVRTSSSRRVRSGMISVFP